MDGLRRIVGGQAADAATTFGGKVNAMKAQLSDAAAKLGEKLIPVLETVIAKLTVAVGWITTHKGAMIALLAAFGMVIVGMIGATVAGIIIEMSAAEAATGGILLAVVALVAGIVWVATHWKQSWADIKKWTDDAVKFLRGPFGTLSLLLLGPLAPMALLALHWQQIWAGIQTVIRTAVPPLLNWFKTLGDKFFDLIQGILSAPARICRSSATTSPPPTTAVKQAHHDFDTEMTGWATDAATLGRKVGTNTTGGVVVGIQTGTPTANAAAHLAIDQVQKHLRLDGDQYSQVVAVRPVAGRRHLGSASAWGPPLPPPKPSS